MESAPELKWSGKYSLLPTTSEQARRLPGDKIILPQSALEELLAAAPAHPSAITPVSRNYSHSPFSISYFQESTQQLPHPLTFRIYNPVNDNVCFAGIQEFSAPEGHVGMSSFLLEALGLDARQETISARTSPDAPLDLTTPTEHEPLQVTIQAQSLAKGAYVRLRPLESRYDPDDWKSLLERQFRESFTTLTKNTVLSVRGVQGETFKFLVDKFKPEDDGVCVVDTDLEVDIEALNETQARETMEHIMSKIQPTATIGGLTSHGGDLDIWKSTEGKLLPGDYVDYTLPSWSRSQPLEISLNVIQDDNSLDLLITPRSALQRSLPRVTSHVFSNFNPARHGTKTLVLSPTNIELENAEALLITVYAYPTQAIDQKERTPVEFQIRARAKVKDDTMTTSNSVDPFTREHEELCRFCQQWIPKQSMFLHTNFCQRNNIVCPQCNAVFKKGSEEWQAHWHCDRDEAYGNTASEKVKHDDIFHTDRACQGCEFVTNSIPDLARHRTTVCPSKLILCRFCHLEVPQEGDPFNPSPEVILSGMTAHELADGARTTECHLCDKIVRLRDMEMHLKHHDLDKSHRVKPAICRNANCGRTLHGIGPKGQIGTAQASEVGNNLGLCSACYGPLYVSMHDPDGKALRRRIERRYLGQLMAGCGKPHCSSEWCKTGRLHGGLEVKGSAAKDALPLVKPLLDTIPNKAEPMFFCVDETSQTRRKIAELVAAENVWEIEWSVAAAEVAKGDLDKMREWLRGWAPKKPGLG